MREREENRRERLEEAAAETQAPREAERLRAEDDARTRARQDDLERRQRSTEETLRENAARLADTGDAGHLAHSDVERASELASEVAEGARRLHEDTRRTERAVRDVEPEEPA